MTPEQTKWSFIIDTDSYSGNFERAMTGYITGCVDDYGDHIAGPYIKMYDEEDPERLMNEMVDYRIREDDGDGFKSPCDIVPSPGVDKYNSVEIFLRTNPTEAEIALLSSRARKFSELPRFNDWDPRPKVLGCRLVREETYITEFPVWSAS